jgi:oligopeptide/dipeptide ABC transporter ATP-binding protein
MLTRVGIPDATRRIDAYPHELSGGMRQRAMIAMALLCGPELLIADEPTTAVDVTIQAQILALIRDLQRGALDLPLPARSPRSPRQSRPGGVPMSVILITHDLGVVAGMADRVAVMYAGRIVEAATTEALFREPRHPYTRGLLQSVPRLDAARGASLSAIPGLPPDLSNLDQGCPFRPRCPLAMARCAESYPPNFGTVEHPVHCFAASEEGVR